MKIKGYYHFQDFVMDESFREYVQGTNPEAAESWKLWIAEHPEVEDEVRRASVVLLTLINHKKEEVLPDKKAALKELMKSVDNFKSQSAVRKITVYLMRAAAVLIMAAGLTWLWYEWKSSNASTDQPVSFNEIIVPVGEKSQIILSDGTHVWINSGSRFRYPIGFGQNSREVTLEGEAYFDVTRKKVPFMVTTHDAEIKVLGTAFNVKSYPEDKKTQTTVVRGLVKIFSKQKGVSPVLVGPDQMAIIRETLPEKNRTAQEIKKVAVINNVNTLAITSWKDQLLVFADETFEDLAIKMERWYNIKISIDDKSLKKERYTGKFVNNETVYQVLEAIALTTPIKYEIENDQIKITRK